MRPGCRGHRKGGTPASRPAIAPNPATTADNRVAVIRPTPIAVGRITPPALSADTPPYRHTPPTGSDNRVAVIRPTQLPVGRTTPPALSADTARDTDKHSARPGERAAEFLGRRQHGEARPLEVLVFDPVQLSAPRRRQRRPLPPEFELGVTAGDDDRRIARQNRLDADLRRRLRQVADRFSAPQTRSASLITWRPPMVYSGRSQTW